MGALTANEIKRPSDSGFGISKNVDNVVKHVQNMLKEQDPQKIAATEVSNDLAKALVPKILAVYDERVKNLEDIKDRLSISGNFHKKGNAKALEHKVWNPDKQIGA
ncbi:MAG: hypothetical protein LBB19_00365 [Puniceicoccales bacterium]|jgi:hypothetical protein|nr:hypothetical protein [Puniceicoccales bacterium]